MIQTTRFLAYPLNSLSLLAVVEWLSRFPVANRKSETKSFVVASVFRRIDSDRTRSSDAVVALGDPRPGCLSSDAMLKKPL